MRYRISQGDEEWVVELDGLDTSGAVLQAWVVEQQIDGDVEVTIEYSMDGEGQEVGPFTVNASAL